MQQMKMVFKHQGKELYDMEALFANLFLIGQQRNITLQQLFDHELSVVPLSILDEFGCLRKGDKAIMVRKFLGIEDNDPSEPSIIIIDGSQLLYHIRWPIPCTGKVIDLLTSKIES